MLSPGSGNTVIKSKLIGRRMFLLTAAKAVVMVGLVGRLKMILDKSIIIFNLESLVKLCSFDILYRYNKRLA